MAGARFKLNAALTPSQAIERLTNDDPTLTTCSLANNAVLQMKGAELVPKIALALEKNTKCTELNMGGCGLTDALVAHIASALAKNTGLVNVNLEENKVGNDGAMSLAKGLESNRTLMQLSLFGQKGTKFGDATLHAVGAPASAHILRAAWPDRSPLPPSPHTRSLSACPTPASSRTCSRRT